MSYSTVSIYPLNDYSREGNTIINQNKFLLTAIILF